MVTNFLVFVLWEWFSEQCIWIKNSDHLNFPREHTIQECCLWKVKNFRPMWKGLCSNTNIIFSKRTNCLSCNVILFTEKNAFKIASLLCLSFFWRILKYLLTNVHFSTDAKLWYASSLVIDSKYVQLFIIGPNHLQLTITFVCLLIMAAIE